MVATGQGPPPGPRGPQGFMPAELDVRAVGGGSSCGVQGDVGQGGGNTPGRRLGGGEANSRFETAFIPHCSFFRL